MKSFTLDGLQQKYGIRRSVVTELVRGGLILPARGVRREYRFSFHDVVLLRMAQDLYGAGFSPRKLTRFLKQLASSLPARSVAGMRITAAGRELVVREDGRLRNADGQLILDFSSPGANLAVRSLPARPTPEAGAAHHFALAESLADSDAGTAAEHYRHAVELAPEMRDAWINLSCVLLDAGQAIEAYASCQEGLVHHPDAALLHFNLGVAQEEMQQPDAALQSYRAALRIDPALADAHYNAGRIAETLGRQQDAIRHLNAYRRSRPGKGGAGSNKR